jgi:hypothetical protein
LPFEPQPAHTTAPIAASAIPRAVERDRRVLAELAEFAVSRLVIVASGFI